MNALSRFRPPEPYVGQSGGDRNIAWAWPVYSLLDFVQCAVGNHRASRRRVVRGWIGFSQVDRYWCACGRRGWIWYEDGFMPPVDTESRGHKRWLESWIACDEAMAKVSAAVDDRLRDMATASRKP